MIPNIEDLLIAELERRIVVAMPETVRTESEPGDGETLETFVTTVETRTVTRNVQEQNTCIIFAWVKAEIAVIFYSQKKRYDYSPLVASFALNPAIKLGNEVYAKVEIQKCEAVEGPYLSNDAWLFVATYPVIEVEDGQNWEVPQIVNVTIEAPDIYPRAEQDTTNEPRGFNPTGGKRFERK